MRVYTTSFSIAILPKNIWRIIYFTLKIETPVNINHIIGSWASNCGLVYKKILLTRISALFWSIWLTRNEVAFNKKPISLCRSFSEVPTGSGSGDSYRRRKYINKFSMCVKL
jgi:hypothetical protein